MLTLAPLIPLLPFLAFWLIIAYGARLPGRGAYVAIGSMLAAGVLSLGIFARVLAGAASFEHPARQSINWLVLGKQALSLGIQIDPLTTVMLLVVTVVGSLIFIYSIGYMQGDPRYPRFFAYLSLFGASMLLLVLADNLLFLMVGWELVGLCSYLLIGFWFERPAAARAAMKAFITTRIGDIFMLIGILLVYAKAGTLGFQGLFEAVKGGEVFRGTMLGLPLVTLVAVLLFGGAVGKSAQVPLHTWLPDAMEGPTPVSALIHAATMVAAGVYMVARLYTVFFESPGHQALTVVAWIGGVTYLMAATIGVVQDDIKRVMAYSTISQLGLMMMGLGLLGFTGGVFHLTTHAFFKALLFLAAGSVIHAMHTNDIKAMGGLARVMPSTYWTMLIAGLALAGVFPLSGFWSKDEILTQAMRQSWPLYVIGLVGAFLTAFYVMRMIFYTFTGAPRWGWGSAHGSAAGTHGMRPGADAGAQEDGHDGEVLHPHESPRVMIVPLWILACFTLVLGFLAAPGLGKPFERFVHFEGVEAASFSVGTALTSSAVALSGILVAAVVYYWRWIPSRLLRVLAGPVYVWVTHKYYVDELYDLAIVRTTLWVSAALRIFDLYVVDGFVNLLGAVLVGLARLYRLFDLYVVDGMVNLVGAVTAALGRGLRFIQTGRAENYLLVIALGVIAIVIGGLLR